MPREKVQDAPRKQQELLGGRDDGRARGEAHQPAPAEDPNDARGPGAVAGLLEMEPLRPCVQRAPKEEVHRHRGHEEHSEGEQGLLVPADGDCLRHVATEAGERVARRPHGDDLARDKEVPPVRPRHEGVVEEARGRGREDEDGPAQRPPDAELERGLRQVLGRRDEALVYAEGHVPEHGGEDEEDRGSLDAQGRAVKDADEEADGHRKEAEDRDGLEDVEGREDHTAREDGAGGQVSDSQGKDEGHDVGQGQPRQGEKEVDGEERGARVQIGGVVRSELGRPEQKGNRYEPGGRDHAEVDRQGLPGAPLHPHIVASRLGGPRSGPGPPTGSSLPRSGC